MKKQRGDLALGTALLLLFLAQDFLHLKMAWFETLQAQKNYRIFSGIVVLGFIGFQWYLSLLRIRGRTRAAVKHYELHKRVGVWAPLIFYIHATGFGFAYLYFLSAIYFGNTVIGLFNPEALHIRQKPFTFSWMVVHVTFSVLLVFLAAYHLWIVAIYH